MFKVGDFLIDLHDKQSGLHKVEIKQCCTTSQVKIFSTDMAHSYWVVAPNFRIATIEEIAAGHRIDHDMSNDSHIDNHVSPLCKVTKAHADEALKLNRLG